MARRARSSSDRRSRSRSGSSRSRKSKSRSSSTSSKSKKSRSRKSRKASSQSGSRRRRSRSRSRSRRSPSRSRRNRRARARGGRRRAERSRSRSKRRNRSSKRRSKSPGPGAKSASASATSEAYGGAYSLYGWGSGYRSWSAWPESSYYSGYSAYQGYQYTQRDYATEKPENYMAFVQQHVREGKNGTEVTLSNNMCQDKHVDDLLLCIESWLGRQYGRSSAQPWQLGTLDLSLNGLSDDSVARIADRLRQLHVRVRCLDLTGNKAGTKGLVALEAYLWNCSEPFQEISLADNEIVVEAGCGEDNPVSSFLRCLYNHPNYPRKTSSDAGVLIHPLVLRLGKNRIADLPGLLRDIRTKVGGRARFRRSAEAYKEPAESEEFLSVHIADLPEEGEAREEAEPEAEAAEDSAWKRRQRRRKAKELSTKDEQDAKESPKSEESEDEKPRKTEEGKEGKKKKVKKENGKSKKKKKKRSKRNVSQEVTEENGKEQTQTQTGPGSDAETEEGEEENSDEVDAEAPEPVEPVEPVEAEVPEPAEPVEPGSSKPSKPARAFSPSALSSEDQSRLKKETAERLRLMEGLVESIGESALGKLAELTVRLLVSGKRSEDMMSELKPFVGKQRASELVDWMDEHCQSGVSVSQTAETADEKGFMLFTVRRTKHQLSLGSGTCSTHASDCAASWRHVLRLWLSLQGVLGGGGGGPSALLRCCGCIARKKLACSCVHAITICACFCCSNGQRLAVFLPQHLPRLAKSL
ncbi:unnamed protein product [Symbiodinium sp. CCMP2592]|nr:unnamed protein product [Symbiodinium sp. CCMP2592]